MVSTFYKQKILTLLACILFATTGFSKEIKNIELPSGEDLEIRVFNAQGKDLIIGLPCDFGKSNNEELTAQDLAGDGYEVWMPDLLSSQMLSKVRSSYKKIPDDDLNYILEQAQKTGKDIYLLASGPDAELLLNVIKSWELKNETSNLRGGVLLFPRLVDGKPTPGVAPKYVDSVGKTKAPLMLIEGGRTPNRWGLKHLENSLSKGGSKVISKIVPDIRGYFFKRADPNRAEKVVTSQLSGLIKVSLFYLKEENKNNVKK
jgi:hypothetical protein